MINDFQLIGTLVIRSLMLTVMIRAQPNQLNRGLIDAMANQLSMIPTNQHPLVIFNIAMGSYQFLDDVHAYYKKIIAISNAKALDGTRGYPMNKLSS